MRAARNKYWADKAKKIRCIETGMIFNSGQLAADWVSTITNKKALRYTIQPACTSSTGYAYGYHWEYVNEGTVGI